MNAGVVFTSLLPEHLLLLGLVLTIAVEIATGRAERVTLGISLVFVAAAALVAAGLSWWGFAAAPFPGHSSVTPATLAAKALVLALSMPVLLMSREEFHEPEFPLLLMSSLYGICWMLSADSFLTLFLGLEIMSLPVYVLVLLAYRRPQAAEGALKYLVLGGAATAMLLMGASLLYGSTGSLALTAFGQALASDAALPRTAVVLVLLAFFVKAAIVPFHTWAPDAYEGASVPVTAYMATIVKSAVLLAAVRLFGTARATGPMLDLLAVLPLASIVWGNLTAMRQPSLRRMIAYSSIAHAGYLYFAMIGAPAGRQQAVAFYLLAYGLLNLLAFAALPPSDRDIDRDRLDNLKGLFHRSPYAAVAIGIAMLSLAGIPPFPGFIAKFLIFKNVVAAGQTGYAVLGLIGSYLGIYFYIRVIQLMFMSPGPAPVRARPRGAYWAMADTASAICLVAALAVAVFPGWVMAQF